MVRSNMCVFAASLSVAGVGASLAFGQVALQPLPALPDGTRVQSFGDPYSFGFPVPAHISADGSTVVALSQGTVMRLRNGVWQSLGAPASLPGDGPIDALQCSEDGEVVVVKRNSSEIDRYVALSGWESRGVISNPTGRQIGVFDSSRDGRYAVAAINTRNPPFDFPGISVHQVSPDAPALTLTQQGSVGTGLGIPNRFESLEMSRDGQRMVGTMLHDGGGVSLATFATASDNFVVNIVPPTGQIFRVQVSSVRISGNGQVVSGDYGVTYGDLRTFSYPFVWTAAGGAVNLPANLANPLKAMSFDGSIGVTFQDVVLLNSNTAIPIATYLQQNGVDTTGWTSLSARFISDDGLTFAGGGLYRFGPNQVSAATWTVTIPSPSPCIFVCASMIVASRRRR